MPSEMRPAIQRLSQAIKSTSNEMIAVVTGAGISLASGIPTFRGSDEDAIWKHDPMEIGTIRFFENDPVEHWSWYLDRFEIYVDAKPNPAHHALADIERWQKARGGDFLLVTQNLDLLHEHAGSENLIKVHGSLSHYRCFEYGCENGAPYGSIAREKIDTVPFLEDPSEENLPRCPACHSLLRLHALLFDEYYTSHDDYGFKRIMDEIHKMDLLIFIGTSFSVGITASFLAFARDQGCPIFSINPQMPEGEAIGIYNIAEKSEELLPQLYQEICK